MTATRNILFIMCDQLRWDYLSCFGHPTLRTPNIDALADRGVRFSNAFVQSASCGPSRMSYYTGRYVGSHRSFGNFVPLPLDERTLGDYLRPHGIRVALDGKTHVEADLAAMRQRGIEPDSLAGRLLQEGGFEAYDRHDGVISDPHSQEALENRYSQYLRAQGYASDNPWLDYANSAAGELGEVLSGWEMRHAMRPARVEERHSETAYTTDRAIEFIERQGDAPWCLHLSYIKPHWPYVAPSPYHHMYGAGDVVPARRSPAELIAPHPLYASYLRHPASVNFGNDAIRERVVPVYMGLVRQIDDHLGRVFETLERLGRFDDTLIIFCSDHGDYLGDHHLGEKELWHDAATKVPLIVCDPDATADATRGTTCDALVEAIDLMPTFLDTLGIEIPTHILEGRSLRPWLQGGHVDAWRDFVVCEFDYSFRTATRRELGRPIRGCRTWTLRDARHKFVHCEGLPPLLFDLQADPDEFHDLGRDPGRGPLLEARMGDLARWIGQRKTCTTATDEFVDKWLDEARFKDMKIGEW